MKKIYLFIYLIFILFSCNTYKKADKKILKGDYDYALNILIEKYRKGNVKPEDVDKWQNLFKESFAKANKRNFEAIQYAKQMINGSEKFRSLYENYLTIQIRTDKLKPLIREDKMIDFELKNFYPQIEEFKLEYANALYSESKHLESLNSKLKYREAYHKQELVKSLYPNYTNIDNDLERNFNYGQSNILLTVIPLPMARFPFKLYFDLTDVKSSFWHRIYTIPSHNIHYDYVMNITITNANVDNVRESQKSNLYEKEIIEKINTSNFNDSTVKKLIKCTATSHFMTKRSDLSLIFTILDPNNKIITDNIGLSSNHNFNHNYYTYSGNISAIPKEEYDKQPKDIIQYPSDQEMINNCINDMKTKLSHRMEEVFFSNGI